MKRTTIHQWRDWLLDHVGGDEYELIRKNNGEVIQVIVARSAMDAENECRRIIRDVGEKGKAI